MNAAQPFLPQFERPGTPAKRKCILDALPWNSQDAQIGTLVRKSEEELRRRGEGHTGMSNP
jgi:hypothetical protein